MKNKELNEKKIYTANQMTGELLLGIVLYGVICYVIYRIIYKLGAYFIEDNDNFLLISGAMVLILQIIMVFVTFKLANIQAFKKGTIYKSDVGKVVKNISFVVIVSARVSDWLSFANSSLTFEYNSVLFAKAYADSPDKEKSKREIKPKRFRLSIEIRICCSERFGSWISKANSRKECSSGDCPRICKPFTRKRIENIAAAIGFFDVANSFKTKASAGESCLIISTKEGCTLSFVSAYMALARRFA